MYVTPKVGTTMMVFSSTRASICSTSMQYRPGDIGISRISTSQYLANLCHTTWTGPHTKFGESVALPAALRFARHRQRAAMPPSMHASDEPMAEHPTAPPSSGAFHRSASIWTHRRSISAVCGYSSLSIMFLLMDRSISRCTSSSSHVWQKVARFCRALPSSRSSSEIAWKASSLRISSFGKRWDGNVVSRSLPA